MDAIVYDKVGKEAEKVREALYGIYPQETIIDAAIASFADGADRIPIKKLVANIEPQQDLHGYDSPWPAGGNVNKCPSISSSMTFAGVTLSPSEDGKCKLVGTATSSGGRTTLGTPAFELPAGTYYLSSNVGYDSAQSNPVQLIATKRSDNSIIADRQQSVFTLAEDTEIYIGINVKSGGVYNTEFYIQLESGSAPTAYSPYSNICPISGWTGAEILKCGKNLVLETIRDASISAAGVLVSNSGFFMNIAPVKKGIQYIISSDQLFTGGFFSNYPSVGSATYNNTRIVEAQNIFVAPITGYVAFRTTLDYKTPQLEFGSVQTPYDSPKGSSISVTFPTEAGTVYGGTLTINPDRTGTLVVDSRNVTIDGVNNKLDSGYGENGANRLPGFLIGSGVNRGVGGGVGSVSNYLKQDSYATLQNSFDIGNSGQMIVAHIGDIMGNDGTHGYNSDTELFAAANAYVTENPLQVCYKLATPVTYQLTSTEVSGILTTLYGTNNIWADCGDIEKLTYRADLGKYIDSHITTAVANALNA